MKISNSEEYDVAYSMFSELMKLEKHTDEQTTMFNELLNAIIEYESGICYTFREIPEKLMKDILELTEGVEFDIDKPLNDDE